jgi:hypothetical protein
MLTSMNPKRPPRSRPRKHRKVRSSDSCQRCGRERSVAEAERPQMPGTAYRLHFFWPHYVCEEQGLMRLEGPLLGSDQD